MSRSPEKIVRDFGGLWEARDPGAIVAALTEDVVYQNVPLPAMHGRAEVLRFITPNLRTSTAITWAYLAVATATDGRTVLTERVDTFFFGDKSVAVPVMGIFELEGALISRWRDYSDIASFVRDMQAIGQMPGPGVA